MSAMKLCRPNGQQGQGQGHWHSMGHGVRPRGWSTATLPCNRCDLPSPSVVHILPRARSKGDLHAGGICGDSFACADTTTVKEGGAILMSNGYIRLTKHPDCHPRQAFLAQQHRSSNSLELDNSLTLTFTKPSNMIHNLNILSATAAFLLFPSIFAAPTPILSARTSVSSKTPRPPGGNLHPATSPQKRQYTNQDAEYVVTWLLYTPLTTKPDTPGISKSWTTTASHSAI